MRRWFDALLVVATAAGAAFLLLPLIALFLRTTPARLVSALDDDAALAALGVSLETSVVAHAVILIVGTPIAYAIATGRVPGKRWAVALVELPLVLPPAVAGIALLAAFGRLGLVGGALDRMGISIAFSQIAVVLAITFVASPFYVRQAIAAFEAVDPRLVDAARTLGASGWKVFARVYLPLARGGLGAGSVLAFARGLGEFGATIMFAGSFEGVTQTLPLAIYAQLGQDLDVALAIGAELVVFSAVLLVGTKAISWARSTSTSASRSVRSISE